MGSHVQANIHAHQLLCVHMIATIRASPLVCNVITYAHITHTHCIDPIHLASHVWSHYPIDHPRILGYSEISNSRENRIEICDIPFFQFSRQNRKCNGATFGYHITWHLIMPKPSARPSYVSVTVVMSRMWGLTAYCTSKWFDCWGQRVLFNRMATTQT